MTQGNTLDGMTFDTWMRQVRCNWCGSGKQCQRSAVIVGVLPADHKWVREPSHRYIALCESCLPPWQNHTGSKQTITMHERFIDKIKEAEGTKTP